MCVSSIAYVHLWQNVCYIDYKTMCNYYNYPVGILYNKLYLKVLLFSVSGAIKNDMPKWDYNDVLINN